LARLQAHRKITRTISFPLRLSLGRYTSFWAGEEHVTNIALSLSGETNQAKYAETQASWAAQRSGLLPNGGSSSSGLFHPADVDREREELQRAQAWYELDAVVVHLGNAHGGHYVTYRRQTQPAAIAATQQQARSAAAAAAPSDSSSLFSLDASSSPLPMSASSGASSFSSANGTGSGGVTWWRMSDEARQQVTLEDVLAQQAYLLIYERVQHALH
jgi:hypothetical protein